ncbi:hypothetical protein D3227_05175 [Mesorhizobium waimense]|uniref:Uncharacterized protein n=1 Tax=Mesorhizobium waimense TaxID=1300307 RepID=A0A3A5KYZ9_9HYPH|nr:hypothetical protein D3227_05175 [Mesorhizobium waimense]
MVYAHDPVRIEGAARTFTKFMREQLDKRDSPMQKAFIETKDTTNGEMWLGVVRGCQIVQAYALKRFTELGEEPETSWDDIVDQALDICLKKGEAAA